MGEWSRESGSETASRSQIVSCGHIDKSTFFHYNIVNKLTVYQWTKAVKYDKTG
ncbi:hypothetical protein [Clostridium sp. Marseille-P3244]|uniref:hypothetical protein n=1 Tax=Clostridium sp. Marseille-P3244 TaxID=1871020 RepID=UPI000A4D1791|nr:hypothetical protein [Clostridium sp. Marseille-P3244]